MSRRMLHPELYEALSKAERAAQHAYGLAIEHKAPFLVAASIGTAQSKMMRILSRAKNRPRFAPIPVVSDPAGDLVAVLPAHPDAPWGDPDIASMVGARLYIDAGHVTITGTITRAAKAAEVDDDLMRCSHIEVRASGWEIAHG